MKLHRAWRIAAACLLACAALAPWSAAAQSSCAVPGNDGPATISGYPNTIHPGSGTASAGGTSLSVGARDARGSATNIAPGDLVLIVQMQDASIDSSNTSSYGGTSQGSGYTSIGASGVYEYATVAAGSATVGAGGGTITLSAPLLNTYTSAGANGSQGQRRFQVLRVPQNSNVTLSGTISAPPWDGNTGGVIAIEAAGTLTWGSATLDAAGRGFRGGGGQCSGSNGTGLALVNTDYRNSFGTGTVNLGGTGNVPGGAKGEGVAGTPILVFVPSAPNNGNSAGSVLWACNGGGTTGTACQAQDGSSAGYPGGTFGRGAPGNAGGGATDGNPTANDQNTGGAGGGNYSNGGHGGYGWTPGTPPGFDTGGFGGAGLPSSPSRLFFGGGGGSATSNNCTGNPGFGAASSGASGGGIVFVRAGAVSGAGNINVQGASANSTLLNDASGGGGAGGSALVFVNNSGGGVGATINASGGNGGSNTGGGQPHGPGGGGSGGYVVLSGAAGFNVAGGNNGTTATSPTSTSDYGSTASSGGVQYVGLTANQIPGAGASPVCFPRITVTKTTTTPSTVQGGIANYRITATNAAGFGTAQVVRLTDVLPANPNFTFAATNAVTLNGGATRPALTNPAVSATSPVWGDFTLPGGGSVTIDFNVNVLAATVVGTYQNPATVDYVDPTRTAAQRATPGGTYTAGGAVPGSNYNSASSTNEDVTVRAAVAIAKAFNPTSIADGGVTALTITLTNPNAVALTNAAFTDNYPAGLENANVPAASTTCVGGSVTATAGANNVALAGATIPASGSCTVTVNVTATIAQTYVNTIPASTLTDTENVTNAASTGGTLLARPKVVKSFNPIAVPQNTDSTLSLAITNPNASQALTLANPALTDTFPPGMVATGGAVTYAGAACGAMAPTTILANATSFSITGGTLGAGGTCTATFAVRAASVGSYANTSGGVTTTQTPNAGNPSNTANLGVGLINISKAFGTTAPFATPGRIRAGQNNTITFTLVNPTGVAQTNASFTDSLVNMQVASTTVGGTCTGMTPAALTVGATNLSFSGINVPAGSCTVTVVVTSNTVGAQNNTTSGVTTTLLPQGPPSNTDTLYVFGPPTITKTFSPAAIGPGTASTMILTINNPNALPLTGLTFTDTYPAGLTNATPLTVGGTCTGVTTTAAAGGNTFNVSVGNLPAGASCTITSAVTASTPGTYNNTTSGIATTEAATGAASNTASLVVLAPPTIAKAFAPTTIGAGGTTTLTFTLTNPNASALANARFTDSFTNMTVAASAIGGTCVGTSGSPPPAVGDTFVALTVPSLAPSSSCTVTLSVTSNVTGTQTNTASGITTTQTPTAGNPSNTANLVVLATPTLAKNFAPGAIQTGANSTLTFTLTNPNAATALTNVTFTDTLANMQLASATAGGTCAGVTFAPALAVNGTTVKPTVATLAANTTCTITVTVSSSVVSSATGHPNTTTGATSVETPTAGTPATGFLQVLGAPTIAKTFVPSAITVGGVSTMVFTITNPNPVQLTGGRFTDTFPANLAINNVNQNFIGGGRGTCTTAIPSAMTAGAAPSVAPLSFANLTVPASGSCTVMVDVTSATAGSYNNTTSGMTTTQTPTAGAASNTANLRVVAGPTLTKAFVTNPILVNGTTVMRFTVTNPNAASALTNIAFTDTLSNMTVNNATAGGTCAGVTFTPALSVGGTQVNPTVATLAGGASCTIDITVQSTVGSVATGHVNTTTGPTSAETPTAGAVATATLYVVTLPTFTKQFAPAGVAVAANSTTTFTITNTSPFALSAVGFTDTFPTAPGAMTAGGAASTNAPCGGTLRDQAAGNISAGDTQAVVAGVAIAASGTCTFNFPLRGAAVGSYVNTTGALAWTATTPAGTIASTTAGASDTLVVGQASITKAFGAATIALNGTTTLTITVTNNSGAAFTNTLNFLDTFPAGLQVAAAPGFSNTCGGTVTSGNTAAQTSVQITNGTLANGATCTVGVTITGTTAGAKSNTVNGTGPAALAGKSDTQTLTVMAQPTVTKSFSASSFTTGDTPTLTITVTNPNAVAITGLQVVDVFPVAPGAMTVAAPLTTTNTCGGTLQDSGGGGLAAGDVGIRVTGGTIAANGSCTFSVNVTAATVGTYTNTITAANVTTTNSGGGAGPASASIVFVLSNLTKSFSPNSMLVGGTTALSFSINKAAAAATQSGIGFTDTLPSGLVVAATPNIQTNCPAGGAFAAPGFTVTAPAGSSSIVVSGASSTAGVTSCVIRLDVTTSGTPTIAACPTPNDTNGAANVSALANIDNQVTNQCVQVAAAVPVLTKAFAPTTINTGATSTLTFTVTQPTGNGTQTFSFNDTLPAGLVIGNPATVGGTCANGTVTATAGASTITVAGRQIVSPATSCTITVPVTTAATPTVGTCPGTPANTNDATAISGTANLTNSVTAQCLTVNAAPPVLAKAFSPTSIPQGGISTLTFTISNGAGNPAQANFGFIDALPGTVVVAGVPNLATTCGTGAVTATAGSGSVTLANGTMSAGQASCIVRVDVTSASTAGSPFTNASANLTASGNLVTTGATATLTVFANASLTKAFNPLFVAPGATSTLTFTLNNGSGNPAQSALAFTDTLASNLVVAATPNIRTSCPAGGALGAVPGGMTVTATAGGGSISVSGASINAGVASCQVAVDLTSASVGAYPNTSANISGPNGGITFGSVNSTLTVSTASLAKAFAASPIGVGATTQLTFTVSNGTGNPAQAGLAFLDTLPSGLVIGTPNGLANTCGGTVTAAAASGSVQLANGALASGAASCTITVNVTAAAAGTYTNAAGNVTGGSANLNTAGVNAQLSVVQPTLTKAFAPATMAVGGTTTLTFTLANGTGNPAQTGINFTDTLPSGLRIAATPNVASTCPSGTAVVAAAAGTTTITVTGATMSAGQASCTISVDLAPAAAPTVSACPAANNTNGGTNVSAIAHVTNGVTPQCVTVTAAVPAMDKAFSGALTVGGTGTLTFTVSQPAGNPTQAFSFTDTLPAGLVVATPSTVGGTCSGGSVTATAGSNAITVTNRQVVNPATSCTITVLVAPAPAPTVATCPAANNTNGNAQVSATTNVTAAISNSAAGGGSSTTGACVTVNPAVPSLDKAFSGGLTVGGSSTLTFTVTQPTGNPTQAFSFTDTLPAGLVVGGAVGGTCSGGSVTATVGSSTITVASRQIVAPATSCTITVPVTTSATPTVSTCPAASNTNGNGQIGATTNITAAISNSAAGGGTSSSGACVAVTAAVPTLDKAFSGALTVGGTSTLTFTVSQPAGNPAQSFSFTDTLPAGLAIASPATVGGTCAGGSVTATAGSGTITVASRQVTGTSCTITVPVTTAAAPTVSTCPAANNTNGNAQVGATTNITPAIANSAAGGGTSTTGACVVVNAAVPTLDKAFGSGLTVGGSSTLTFTVSQPAGNPTQTFSFTDTLPAGLVVGGAAGGTCSGGSVTATAGSSTITVASRQLVAPATSCTITVPVTSSATPTVSTCPAANNTNGNGQIGGATNLTAAISNSAAGGGTSTTGACVSVAAAVPTLDKAFSGGLTVGGTSTLTFTVSQPAGNPAQTFSFTDTLPAGLVIASPATVGGTCSGGSVTATAGSSSIAVANRQVSGTSCTITVPVTTSATPTISTCPAAGNTNGNAQVSGATNLTAAIANSAAGGGTSTTGACVAVTAAVPTLDKAFSGALTVGGTSTLTFTVAQPAGNPAQSFSFTDTLPAGLVIASPATVGGTCAGGSVTATAGSSIITVASRQVSGTSCTITVPVTTAAAPTVATCPAANNTNGNAQVSGTTNITAAIANSAAGGGTSTTGACVAVTAAVPTLDKAFSGGLTVGATSTLTFTVSQPAGNPAQTFSFTDTLPAGLVIASPATVGGTCAGGSVTATAGSSSIAVAGRQVTGASCTITVPVTTAAAPTLSTCPAANNTNGNAQISGVTNVTAAVSNSAAGGGTSTTGACVAVTAAVPTLNKAFSGALAVGGTSTLTFTVSQPAGNPTQSFSFTDTLPAGLVIASPATIGGTCTGGTVTATAGSTTITVASRQLVAPATTCTITVPVTTAAAPTISTCPAAANTNGNAQISATTNVTAAIANSAAGGGTSTTGACVVVAAAVPTLDKAFSGGLTVGGTTTLTFTLAQPAGNPAQNLSFTDTLPAGLVVASPATVGGTCAGGTVTATAGSNTITVANRQVSGASCTITVPVTTAAPATAGTCPVANNTNGNGQVSGATNVTVAIGNSAAGGGTSTTGACVSVAAAVPTLDKTFSGALTVGGTTTLTFTIAQPAGNPTQSFSFTDTLPAGLVLASPATVGGSCANGSVTATAGTNTITVAGRQIVSPATSCTITVPVTTAAAPTVATCPAANNTNGAAQLSGTSNLSVTISNSAAGGGTSTTGACVTVNGAVPSLTKGVSPGSIAIGGTTTLTFTVTQPAGNPTQAFSFTDVLPSGLVVASPNTIGGTCSGGSVTATAGSNTITVSNRQIVNPAASCTITVPITTSGTPNTNACPVAANTNGNANLTAPAPVNITNNVTDQCVTVFAPPTASKSFNPTTIGAGQVSTLRLTLGNPAGNSAAATSLAMSDPLGTFNLAVATTPSVTFTPAACGTLQSRAAVGSGVYGAVTAGHLELQLTVASLAAGTTCQVDVNVTGSTDGVAANVTSAPTATGPVALTGAAASASLTVVRPTLTKLFGAASINVGGSTTLTFTLNNGGTAPAQSGINFTDTLPSGLIVAATPGIASTCPSGTGVVSAPASGNTITVTGATIASGQASCTITVNVTHAAAPTVGGCPQPNNTNGAANISATANVTNSVASQCLAVTAATPALNKAFAAGFVVGGGTTLTFTVTQPSGNPASTFSFTDTLPAGLVVASGPAGGTCTAGTLTASAGSSTITVANYQVTGTSCTITLPVTSSATPTVASCPQAGNTNGNAQISATTNITAAIANSAAGGGTSTTGACVTVNSATPSLDKAFAPAAISVGGTTTLTFTISQSATNPTSTFSFVDTLPAGLAVGTGAVGGSCSGGAVTANPGSNTITVASRQIVNPATSCTITVPVTTSATPTAGSCPVANNTNGAANMSGLVNVTNNVTSKCVTVYALPTNTKSFTPASIGFGATSTVTFTLANANAIALTNGQFTDTLANMSISGAQAAGGTCAGAGANNFANGATALAFSGLTVPANGSCTVTVVVTSTTVGANPNTASGLQTTEVSIGPVSNTATLTVTAAAPTVSKTFVTTPIQSGQTSTLQVTVTNPNAGAITVTNLTDSFPATPGAGLQRAASPNTSSSGSCGAATVSSTATSVTLNNATIAGGGSCTFQVDVTAATSGTYTNTIPAGSVVSNAGSNNVAATAQLVVSPVANVGISKLGPATVATGSPISYSIAITNAGPDAANATTFADAVPAQISGVTASCGSPIGGAVCGAVNVAGNNVTGTVATLPSGGSVSITISGTATGIGAITNTATVAAPSGTTDPVAGNNTSSVSTTILAPDLTIAKSHAGNFTVGTNGTYTIAVTNQPGSASTAGAITVTDSLPSGLGYVSATGTGWACSFAAPTVTCSTGATLAAGTTSNPITLVVSVASTAAPSVTNFATVSGGGEPAATTGNNTASDNAIVTSAAINTFQPDGVQSAMPGTVVFYPHTYTAGSAGSVTFSASTVQVPVVTGWNVLVYRDTNCNGVLDGAEGNTPLTAAVAVNAGDVVCIVVKDSIPATAPYNARDVITVTATEGASILTRTDTTTVGAANGAGLTLAKAVRNVTLGGAAGTSNTARPNDILEYTITFTNTSSGTVSSIVVTDATPAFTLYQSAQCAGTLPGNLTGCSVTSQPAVNGAGSIVWTLTGTLLSGGSGTVSYQVRVAP